MTPGAAPLAPAVRGAVHWAASGAAPREPAVQGVRHWAASGAAPREPAVRGAVHWAASGAAPREPGVRALDAKCGFVGRVPVRCGSLVWTCLELPASCDQGGHGL